MKYLLLSGCIWSSIWAGAQVQRASLDSVKEISKFAFGSSNHQNLPQEMWYNVLDNKAELWIWLGDNIYGNTEDSAVLKEKYLKQLQKESYEPFIRKVPVIGTWDDHDYGAGGSDSSHPSKKASQQLFLDFIGEPSYSARRSQEGIYTSYTFGEGDRKIKFILLDVRYFRTKPGDTGDILGAAQWEWLEKECTNSDAVLHFICSPTQFLSDKAKKEKWMDYPTAQARMLKLIEKTNVPGVIFLSGDLQCGEVLKYSGGAITYPVYEFTSSGLTHTGLSGAPKNTAYKVSKKPFCGLNYGLVSINWNAPYSVKFELRNVQDFVEQEFSIYLEDLKAP